MMLHSQEAEQSVIGAAMLNGKVIDSLADIVSAGDFWEPAHATIWAAIIDVACRQGKPADLVTVGENLEATGALENIGGYEYLAGISRDTPTTANAETYARIVHDKAKRRSLFARLNDLKNEVKESSEDFATLIDNAQGRLLSLVSGESQGAARIQDSMKSMLDTMDRRLSGEESPIGVSFGLKYLDDMTMGMHPGEMIVVGARPSMGKTAFGLSMLRAVALNDKRPAIIFSMEMSREAITTRLSAAASDIDIDRMRDPNLMGSEDWPKLTRGANMLNEANIVIDDRPSLTPSQIRGASKRWKEHLGDMGVIIVDYLGLIKPEGKHGSREQEVASASRTMKALSKEIGCPVVVLSQLNRNLENRDIKSRRPRMSDLRESGAVEQDADLILFLYRHEVYAPDDLMTQGVAEIIIGKHREGRLGTAYSSARLARAQFKDLDVSTIMALKNPAPEANYTKKKSAMADF